MELKFKKVQSGHYVSEDGRYEAVKDVTGYVSAAARDGDGINAGCDDDGWAAVRGDETLNWFNTKREAIEFMRDHAR
jgi:hypothetical protein